MSAGYEVLVHNMTDGDIEVIVSEEGSMWHTKPITIHAGSSGTTKTDAGYCVGKIVVKSMSGSAQGQVSSKSPGLMHSCKNFEAWAQAPTVGGQKAVLSVDIQPLIGE